MMEHIIQLVFAMYLNKLPILLLIVCVARIATALGQNLQYAQVQLPGPCPKISYITNLETAGISGWYYRPYTNFNYQLCFNNEGQTMFVSQYDNTTLTINTCCRSAADPKVSYCGAAVGSGTASTNVPRQGEFIYKYLNNTYSVYVLDTDYKNINVAYGCKPASQPYLRDEIIFVLSREYNLNESLTARAREVLGRNGIQWSKLKTSKQGASIPYPPLPQKC